jgi:predicted regulator of Ras-like GTPase activity (Roadblock/LC7/MglB family)
MIACDSAHLPLLLAGFVSRVPGVRFVAVVTGDGRALASSGELSAERIGDLAGVSAGIGGLFAGWADTNRVAPITSIMVEMGGGCLLLMPISDNASCVAWTDWSGNVGDAAYELAQFVGGLRTGSAFQPPTPRD